jgi:hypothetical protein
MHGPKTVVTFWSLSICRSGLRKSSLDAISDRNYARIAATSVSQFNNFFPLEILLSKQTIICHHQPLLDACKYTCGPTKAPEGPSFYPFHQQAHHASSEMNGSLFSKGGTSVPFHPNYAKQYKPSAVWFPSTLSVIHNVSLPPGVCAVSLSILASNGKGKAKRFMAWRGWDPNPTLVAQKPCVGVIH